MSKRTLTIATRQSPLALWQSNHIRAQLMHHWPELKVELLPMKTTGDKFLKEKLVDLGGKGLFVKELEEALLNQQADLAVHSMKDVPVDFPEGLTLPIICKRESPFDALVSQNHLNLNALPHGSTVGTVSLRRQNQLLTLRPDLKLKPLRGNILTRMKKMESGEYDAIILAVSGLQRMKLEHQIRQIFTSEQMLPAGGQGALGIECRDNDPGVQKYLVPLNDEITATCVLAERKVNHLLGGNCHTPLAVYCYPKDQKLLSINAKVTSADGKKIVSHQTEGPFTLALSLAKECADALQSQGAQEIIDAAST